MKTNFLILLKKKAISITVITIFLIVVLYFLLGFLNSYIGYFGYDKDKYRRFSKTKIESIERKVFLKNLHFEVDSVVIDDIFIEYGYKWGNSSSQTILLKDNDTIKKNKPDFPCQIIISFKENQGINKVYIPESNNLLLKDRILQDTLFLEVFIRDSLNNLKNMKTLKIW